MLIPVCVTFTLLLAHTRVASGVLTLIPDYNQFNVSIGGSLVLTCTLTGVDPVGIIVNIQWFFNNNGLEILDKTPGKDNTPFVDKSVPLTNKLYITNIMDKHAGTYTCQAVLGGDTQSRVVQVVIFRGISFDYALTPQNPISGTQALIQCRVSGQPIPVVFWRYRGQRLLGGGRYTQNPYGLYIDNITQADNGVYDCCAEVEQTGSFSYSAIDVIVYVPATIVSFNDVEKIASQEYVFHCAATGVPQPKAEFYRGTDSNPLYSTDRVQWDGDAGNLYFRPLIKDDDADYRCRAYNSAGEDSATAHLTVLVPPTVYLVKNVTQNEGAYVILECKSFGWPAPAMTFRKEGSNVDYVMGDNDGGRIVLSSPEPGTLDMLVKNLRPDDMSNYTCRATNKAGWHHLNGTITVNFAPRFPLDQPTQVSSWAGKTRNMTCYVLAEPVPRFDWFHMNTQLVDNETFRIYRMFKSSNLQIRIREYDETSIYGLYNCRASNQLGQANRSITLVRATLPGRPANATPYDTTPSTTRLYITPPNDLGGSELLGYQIQFDVSGVLEFFLSDPFYIEYLRAGYTYTINIRARTEVGVGPPLQISVQTPEVREPYPIVITSSPVGLWPFQYTVTWRKPETGGREIREYEFRMRRVRANPQTYDVISPLEDWTRRIKYDDMNNPMMYFLLEALNPGSFYQLEIRALNDIGWSLPNTQFVFSTTGDTLGLFLSASLLHERLSLSSIIALLVLSFVLIIIRR